MPNNGAVACAAPVWVVAAVTTAFAQAPASSGARRALSPELEALNPPVPAGHVNSGSFDPIEEVCERAHASSAWVHVDGAFGLWARTSQRYAHLVRGMEQADSWSTDGHKWLNVPYDCGIALVRDGQALASAMAIQAAYIPSETPQRNPFDYTPEFSRRARGVDVCAALRSLGRRGVAELIERNCAAVQQDGTCWAGGTVWRQRTAMRISVCSWATTEADVDASVAAILRARDRVAATRDR